MYSFSNPNLASMVFSSSNNQPVVYWFQRDSNGYAQFYENKYLRTVSDTSFTITKDSFTGIGLLLGTIYQRGMGVAEICVWSASMTQPQITNMFDTYFKPRYPNVFYTSSA